VVLFIDEIHTLVGAGAGEGAMDAANLLKPALARGELRCIGATTLNEYRKYVEKDAALERRFQPVLVEEPSVEDAITILRGLKERYEVHHGVRISDAALVAAATLSDRYLPDRFLPDKAIDCMDEAASRLRIEIDSLPAELDSVERRLRQLEIERAALKKEKDAASRDRLAKLERESAELGETAKALRADWQAEKQVIDGLKKLKERIERFKTDADRAEREGNLERVAQIRYGEIPSLQREQESLRERLAVLQRDGGMLKEEIGEEEVAEVISRWTGIPVARLVEGEREKLGHMEEQLRTRVIGQQDALVAVADAVRRARADGARSVPQTPAARQSLILAMKHAESLGHNAVNPEHLFLGLLDLESEPLVQLVTANENIDVNELRINLIIASQFDKSTRSPPPEIDG
jgi:ATP-dependent Clp protease ATP-binding subunit ClpB